MFNDFNSGIINSRPYLHKIPIKFWNVKSEFIPFSSLFDFGTSFWSYHKIFEIPEKNDNCTITSIKKVEDNLMLWFSKIPKEVSQSRKNISLFNFREPGDNLNKLKLWDSTIIIDNRKELYNLLFPHKFNCGNSILILPDKRFIYIGSDPHSEAFYLTGKQIEGILNDK